MVSASIHKSIHWELFFNLTYGVKPLQPISAKMLYFGRYVRSDVNRYKKREWSYIRSLPPEPSRKINWRSWFSRLFCIRKSMDNYFIYPSGLVMKNTYYYEISFQSDLDDNMTQCVSFGLTASGYEFDQLRQNQMMIGWTPQSIGWHSDDGFIFWQNEKMLGERYKKYDVLGCGYDYATRHVFFTKNGEEVFRQCMLTLHAPIASIAMDGSFSFRINVGQMPFLFQGAGT